MIIVIIIIFNNNNSYYFVGLLTLKDSDINRAKSIMYKFYQLPMVKCTLQLLFAHGLALFIHLFPDAVITITVELMN